MLSIKLLKRNSLTFFRHATGYYSAGKWVEGSPTTIPDVLGSLQSLKPNLAAKILPKGVSTEDSYLFYTLEELITYSEFSKIKPDYVVISGRTYEVHSVAKWDNHSLLSDHNHYLLIRRSKDSEGGD